MQSPGVVFDIIYIYMYILFLQDTLPRSSIECFNTYPSVSSPLFTECITGVSKKCWRVENQCDMSSSLTMALSIYVLSL